MGWARASAGLHAGDPLRFFRWCYSSLLLPSGPQSWKTVSGAKRIQVKINACYVQHIPIDLFLSSFNRKLKILTSSGLFG